MKLQTWFAGAVASVFLSVSTVAASATTLTDGTFSSVTTTYAPPPGGDVLYFAPCNCGNPSGGGFPNNPGLRGTIEAVEGGISDVGFIDTALSYNPSTQGAIASISASYDRLISSLSGVSPVGNIFYLVIEQGGKDYIGSANLGGTDSGGAWHTLSASGLTASNFQLFNLATASFGGVGQPDFSSSGAAITFGVLIFQTFDPTQIDALITENFDNLSITIDQTSVTQTPLPASLPLFATGLGALGLLGWRRKRKAQAAA